RRHGTNDEPSREGPPLRSSQRKPPRKTSLSYRPSSGRKDYVRTGRPTRLGCEPVIVYDFAQQADNAQLVQRARRRVKGVLNQSSRREQTCSATGGEVLA